MTNYTWTVSAGGSITAGSTSEDITVTWSTVGAKTVTVTYTDGNGCNPASPTSKTVNAYALPVPTITGSASILWHPVNRESLYHRNRYDKLHMDSFCRRIHHSRFDKRRYYSNLVNSWCENRYRHLYRWEWL
ncbi:MAG: hypothetical protein IPN68_09225 [Bacteroidetes bacterium]|nr:hypothetical protein [Bacteroidota bacterium]